MFKVHNPDEEAIAPAQIWHEIGLFLAIPTDSNLLKLSKPSFKK
jgi:hypothetical protein